MPTNLPIPRPGDPTLIPADADKDTRHRLTRYLDWLADTRRPWWLPDLIAYRDYLLRVGGNNGNGLKPESVQAHLSTVRGWYADLLRDGRMSAALYQAASERLHAEGFEDNPANRKAVVDELRTAIQDAIHPATAPVRVKKRQDRPDTDFIRLTVAQANALIAAPGTGTRIGLRDTALIAFALCTGLRESELIALDVADLRQRFGGALAVHVREGKGCKERLVPYGDNEQVLSLVDAWLKVAKITAGRVFPIAVRTVQYAVGRYPVIIDGQERRVKPHDLRRTCARRWYNAGMELDAIRLNLGHADLRTTLEYIGPLDAEKRRSPAIYTFPRPNSTSC